MPRTDRYALDLRPRARRQLSAGPPRGLAPAAAAAALRFITGPLLDNPRRLGKPLRAPLEKLRVARCGPDHRIRYAIDEPSMTVVVFDVSRRADSYGRE